MLDHPIGWITFGLSSSITRTVVHFFPAGEGITAPYQANCMLSLLAPEKQAESVMLEGARLSQPDGVRLDQVFPEAADSYSGPFGLLIELSTPQPKIDLSASICIIEFASRTASVKFRPCPAGDAGSIRQQSLLAIRNPRCLSSLISVNADNTTGRAAIKGFRRSEQRPDMHESVELAVFDVPGHGVSEIPMNDLFFEAGRTYEGAWGGMEAAGLYVESDSPGLVHYAAYRDSDSQRLISVVGL